MRSAPRSPDPVRGTTPCAFAGEPFGTRVAPGARRGRNRGAHADPDGDERLAADGRDIRRRASAVTVSERRARYSEATLAPSTASSRMPKYISSTTPTSPATTKHATARMSAPVPAGGQRPEASHRGLTVGLRWERERSRRCVPGSTRSRRRCVRARAPPAERVGMRRCAKTGIEQRGDVVGDDEAASVERGPHLRGAHELQRRARARAEAQVGVRAGRVRRGRPRSPRSVGRDVHGARPCDQLGDPRSTVTTGRDGVERVDGVALAEHERFGCAGRGSPSRCAS